MHNQLILPYRIMFTMGGCFYAAIILLPQRFQAVNGISAERAGINLLPFTIVSPVFSGLCGVLLAKYQKSVGPVLFISSVFTVVGIAMLGTLSSDTSGLEPKVYGFELILAIGLGLMMPPIFFFIKVEYDDSDLGKYQRAIRPTPFQKILAAILSPLNQLRSWVQPILLER